MNAEDGEGRGEDGEEGADGRKAARRAAMLRDVNPNSTLESSFEALNVKKFDLAFAVDPLFHKTSAQFDEGGARGKAPHPPASQRVASYNTFANALICQLSH